MSKTSAAVLATLFALATAGAASAKTWSCEAQATGPSGSRVTVFETVSERGDEGAEYVYWTPPGEGAHETPMLVVGYPVEFGQLGAPISVDVGHMATLDGTPASQKAEIVVEGAGGEWRRPWPLYAANVREMGTGALRPPKDARAVGFYGAVPMAAEATYTTPALNETLLRAAATARSFKVRGVGDAGDSLGARSFTLSDTYARDRLYHDALLRLRTAVGNYRTACKAAS